MANKSTETLNTAVALAKAATETASALAQAKTQSDIVSAVMANDIATIKISIAKIENAVGIMPDKFVLLADWKDTKAESILDRADLREKIEKMSERQDKSKEFQDTLTGKMIVIGSVVGVLVGFIMLIAGHYWPK